MTIGADVLAVPWQKQRNAPPTSLRARNLPLALHRLHGCGQGGCGRGV